MSCIRHVVVIGGGVSGKHCVDVLVKCKNNKVTIIQANEFVEWPIAMPKVIVNPSLHGKALSTDKSQFQISGVSYTYGVVSSVDPANKSVILNSGATVAYDALVVATGFDMPLLYPVRGASLQERKDEIIRVGESIKKAETIVVNGGGIVGMEVAGTIRAAYPEKKVILLCKGQFLSTQPEKQRHKAATGLNHVGVEIMSGVSMNVDVPQLVKLERGSFKVEETEVNYDVYIPAYSRGPNTGFLNGAQNILDSQGRVRVNQNLQNEVHPEIFAVGVNNADIPFIGMAKLEAQWKTVAQNVDKFLGNKPLTVYKEGMPYMTHPPLMLIAAGQRGWGSFDFSVSPPPLQCCCCCGLGGFPCCPPPCCWCICHPMCCGLCCRPAEGAGIAKGFEPMLFKSFGFHFKGAGKEESKPSQGRMV